MFTFDMSTQHDFASFQDTETGRMVYVESFDNREFTVLFGTPSVQVNLGIVVAESDASLNEQLQILVAQAYKDEALNERLEKLVEANRHDD